MFKVPFEALVRRQIARLLDPGHQSVQFVYDELMKVIYTAYVCYPRMSSSSVNFVMNFKM